MVVKMKLITFLSVLFLNSLTLAENMEIQNELLQVVIDCRDSNINKKPKFFTREFISTYLGMIIQETDLNYVQYRHDIARSVIDICSHVKHIQKSEIKEVKGRINLTINYKERLDGNLKEVAFGFIKENENWLICIVMGDRESTF